MQTLTRRGLLVGGVSVLGAAKLVAAAPPPPPRTAPQMLMPSTCRARLAPTDSWTNVPEYLWGAPERPSFLADSAEGQPILLTGRVLTTGCGPIAKARLEFWHTNSKGQYDMAGFRFRGLQFADRDGRFRLETIMPGYYSPRRHIHFLVGARVDLNRSGVLLTNAVELPTDDEIKALPEMARGADGPRSGMSRQNGVLVIPYDIVMEIG